MPRACLDYASYINLPALLATQCPITPAEDSVTWGAERFFIICHQTSELWASQILYDLEEAARQVENIGNWSNARMLLTRCASTSLMLSRQIAQLADHCPREVFHKFRPALQSASAGQSEQFQQLIRVGAGGCAYVRRLKLAFAESGQCAEGAWTPGTCSHSECISAHALHILERGLALWRQLHLLVAWHFIQDLPGTGGTSGVEYLKRRLAESMKASTEALNCGSGPIRACRTFASLTLEVQMLECDVRRLGAGRAVEEIDYFAVNT